MKIVLKLPLNAIKVLRTKTYLNMNNNILKALMKTSMTISSKKAVLAVKMKKWFWKIYRNNKFRNIKKFISQASKSPTQIY
jgi:hypothetical protein